MPPYMGDVWVIGMRLGDTAISVCPFTKEGLGPEEENTDQCLMLYYHGWWICSVTL